MPGSVLGLGSSGQRQRARGRELAVEQRQEELGVRAALSLLSNGDGSGRSSSQRREEEAGGGAGRRRRQEEPGGGGGRRIRATVAPFRLLAKVGGPGGRRSSWRRPDVAAAGETKT